MDTEVTAAREEEKEMSGAQSGRVEEEYLEMCSLIFFLSSSSGVSRELDNSVHVEMVCSD